MTAVTETTTANPEVINLTRTLGFLERAQTELRSIDLRSLRGASRDAVREARTWTEDSIKAVKLARKDAKAAA